MNFVLPPNRESAIVYHVQRLRDGNSYSSRSVVGMQDDKAVCTCMVSFHKKGEKSTISHQNATAPEHPPPPSTPADESAGPSASLVHQDDVGELMVPDTAPPAFDNVPIDLFTVGTFITPSGVRLVHWIRPVGSIDDDPAMHQCAFAFMSDYGFLFVSMLPHIDLEVEMMASLDHTIYFHRPFSVKDWMLVEVQTPQAGRGRAMVSARLFDQAGALVASVVRVLILICTIHQQLTPARSFRRVWCAAGFEERPVADRPRK